ncbi:MAG: hypothetical protein KJ908_05120 [Acidobacteria bacterium]|nr:hypothetical protein [Acidobacteriota bacterium]MBU4253337.1 hypothetical protein [Acidobacteriota bacterium]MBU4329353.1 hypothetical protein [Acidobacteriota bacterium]MBU4495192.1 hypothetical protein [Acidobacteriota bacterium]
MNKLTPRRIWLAPALLLFLSLTLHAAEELMPVSQVKAGMKGKGRTVFLGNTIEEFDVEILGVLNNISPKRHVILARLSHPVIDKAGNIQGMSGSPVYIDGKLVGAVAYSIGNFTKETIAGITPIADMMDVQEKKGERSSLPPRYPLQKELSLDDMMAMNQAVFQPQASLYADGRTITPLSIPLVLRGFSNNTYGKARDFFSRLGFHAVLGGGSGQSTDTVPVSHAGLRGGDPVGVQLVRGDVEVSALGTVTYVDGNKVLAFGHPMFNLGSVDYAMTRASVMAVVPSMASSFKLGNTAEVVGRITQDRSFGVYGELGERPRFIPMNISMIGARGQIRDYKVFLCDDNIITPAMTNMVVASLLSAEERALGNLTIRFTGDIFLENGQSINLEDLYTGIYDSAVSGLSNLLAAAVFYLTNNEFADLSIFRIDLKIQVTEEIRFAYLERVWLDKYEARSGERILIRVFYRNHRGETSVKDVPFATPNLPSGSQVYLAIGDARSMQSIEMSQYRNAQFVPRNLNQLIRLLGNLRKNNRIYFKVFASKPGLFLQGEEMPNLPPSLKSMLASPRAASSAPVEITRSTLSQYQIPIDHVFQGGTLIPITIK